MRKTYWVYIMASKTGTLYIGMTNNLDRRVYEHRNNLIEGFTKKYACHRVVFAEEYYDVQQAIEREKQLKKWNRKKKEWLIRLDNPSWKDLTIEWNLDQFC